MISASSAKRSRASPARRSSQGISPGSTSSPTLTNTVSLHLLPRVDHKNGSRRTSSRGGRCFQERNVRPRGETNFVQKGFRPLHQAKRISSKPTSSPAMTNTVDLHLLPMIGQQNDTRRTSSPGGCCCFQSRSSPRAVLAGDCRQSSAPLSSTPRFFHWLSGKMSGAPPIGAYQESTTHSVPPRSLITAVQWG